MSDYRLSAQSREEAGKGSSRRLRRLEDLVPAIVYGGKTSLSRFKWLIKISSVHWKKSLSILRSSLLRLTVKKSP